MVQEPIAQLLEKVAAQLHPEIDKLLDEGEDRGRRLRARRRARTAAGNFLALATILAAGLTFGLRDSPGWAPPTTLAGASGTSLADAPAPSTARSPTSVMPPPIASMPAPKLSTPASAAGLTRSQMLDTLRSLLPAGAQLSHVSTDTGPGALEVDYDDGHGAVDLIVTVTPTNATTKSLTCPHPLWSDEGTRPAGALPISCTMRTPHGGGVERDAVMYADSFGFYGYNIHDQRPDGVTVFIQVANGINHTLPQVDRATPPGSMKGWTTLAENPAWKL
jgi:hypothetical protein